MSINTKIGKFSNRFFLSVIRSQVLPQLSQTTTNIIHNVAIIGAGAAGLVTGQIFQELGYEITMYEENDSIGGVWKLRPNTAMYPTLRTNLPKEVMSFNHEDHFDAIQPGSSFLSPEDIQTYLEEYTDRYSLRSVIQFQRRVIAIEPPRKTIRESDSPSKWRIISKSTSIEPAKSGEETEEEFDAVIVCNGHFHVPYLPNLPGLQENFHGVIYHSKEYQNLQKENYQVFQGKRIVVVGSRSSGTDIARELSNKSFHNTIFVANRNMPADLSDSAITTENPSIFLLPQLLSCEKDGKLLFLNQFTLSDVDVIIYCTGYNYDYPFLSKDIEYPVQFTNKSIRPLYQLLTAIPDPTLAFIGLPFLIIPFPLFYFQALYLALVYRRIISLPSQEQQLEWLKDYEAQILTEEVAQRSSVFVNTADAIAQIHDSSQIIEDHYHQLGMKQFDYYRNLTQQCYQSLSEVVPSLSSSSEDHDLLKTFYHHNLRYIQIIQEMYIDNSQNRPKFVGGEDSYRNRVFTIDREEMTWSVRERK